jgi:NADH dehydrogenase
MTTVPHVVVVGGGFGGLAAARALATSPVRVTLVDRHNYHLFQPLLYQVATAALSPGDIASPIRWILRRQQNVRVLLADARAIDASRRVVVLDAGPAGGGADTDGLPFDYLILATGATHAYFGHPEWADRAPGLKTLDDALEIRRRVLLAFEAAERETRAEERSRLLTFVIVGGGPTGVELAGALGEIARRTLADNFRSIRPESSRIVLLEGAPHLLGAFPARLRDAARTRLARLGVEVLTGHMVTDVTPQGVAWRTTSGEAGDLGARTVIWAAGVAASPLLASLGVPLDGAGRVRVDAALNVPGQPSIFVIGDACAFEEDGRWLPGVAQVARQQGAHAALNIRSSMSGEAMRPFRYRDYGSMATIGRGAAVAVVGPVRTEGFLAWLLWLFVHLVWLVGFRNRVAVLGEWAWAYLTFQRRVRLITGAPRWPRQEH